MATLIGDLLASKRSKDRSALQRSVDKALRTVNAVVAPPQPLEPTIGDEFQGGFSNVASAARASLLLRLELLEHAGTDSRYGLGYGAVTVFTSNRSPISQDGPGWWSARAAIDRAKRLSDSPRTSFARTCVDYWADDSHLPRRQRSFLLCRDATVDQMSSRERRLLMGLLLDRPQSRLAAQEAITQSAVSQSLRRSGAFAIEAAQRRLEGASE